jgi:hypothetical protein
VRTSAPPRTAKARAACVERAGSCPRTLALLAYLILADGRSLHSRELAARIWGPHKERARANLDTAVRRLQRAGCRLAHRQLRARSHPTVLRLDRLPDDVLLLERVLPVLDAIRARQRRPDPDAIERWLDASVGPA